MNFPSSKKTIRQFYVRPGYLSSTSVNFPCGQLDFRLLSMRLVDLPSTSINFHVAGRPSINFHQPSVQPGDLLLTSVNFPHGWDTFRQLSSTFRTDG